ncbi:ABC-2 type transport system ATP-binding protein [Daejeonella rubra]|uniref:ABC-2 type transport system ATP-binding protein n=1 Tax=Daejeonella rubra TaxID=990371 RepID=A0A1G9WFK4_9SPHI|nr:ATP-binding cassette domain-containing protein [Daejeonella rubra]SDM83043.1 ABC-2 type transport system ATP-binding protein [Daejeonella rubra]
MPDQIVETKSLSYHFGINQVLDNVSLRVEAGSIYGFLGPNGAGKTTTIKILLNLLHSDSDKVYLFGKEFSKNRIEILSKIGSLIEQPAIYHHLSGRENLINRARLLQIPKIRVGEILKLVDLTESADKKAGKYSLGMKQRLGIGLALLPDPELLILDEPTNGLDPNGIIDVRNLLRKLVSEMGKTVFISSHMLSEVEKMVTHLGIINRGKLVFQGSLEELHKISKKQILIQASDPVKAKVLLSENGYPTDLLAEILYTPYISKEQNAEINSLLVRNNHKVYSLSQSQENLENLFLSITQ